MVPVRPRRDQTRRAGRRLGTAGTRRSGRPAGGPGGRGVRRSRVGGLEPSGGAEVGAEQVVGDESGCVRRLRRRRRAGRGGSCAGAVCRRLRRVRRAARSGLSSSAVSCSGVPAAPVRRAVLRSRGALLVGGCGGLSGGARGSRSRPGVGQQCAGDTGACVRRVQGREPGWDGERHRVESGSREQLGVWHGGSPALLRRPGCSGAGQGRLPCTLRSDHFSQMIPPEPRPRGSQRVACRDSVIPGQSSGFSEGDRAWRRGRVVCLG